MTQRADILAYLQSGRSLTPLEALDFWGSLRLGARTKELRNLGYPIITEPYVTPSGKHVASYSLKERQEALW